MTTIIVLGDVNIGRRRSKEQRMSRTAREVGCSVIDEEVARCPPHPELEGAIVATAGPLEWVREGCETEADFLGRCRAEAAEAGYQTLAVRSYVSV